MVKKMEPGKVIRRKATTEERARHRRVRQKVHAELPEIKRRARQALAHATERGLSLEHTVAVLKAVRLKKGLSLSDINHRTGIQSSTLSRLENDARANPTVGTLNRYAHALGKEVRVILDEAKA